MRRQIAAALCSAILGFAGSANAVGDGQIYSSIKELMESIVDPSADALWGAVGTVVDKEGFHESFPKTPEEWLDVRRATLDRKSTRLNSSHITRSRMPSSA